LGDGARLPWLSVLVRYIVKIMEDRQNAASGWQRAPPARNSDPRSLLATYPMASVSPVMDRESVSINPQYSGRDLSPILTTNQPKC